ncbi:MAG TPA: hypothetical protein VF677_11890 [Flavobacterium sp.]|jgi:hypothetical protein
MSNINTTYNDRVRYTLKSKNLDSLIVTEPIGWTEDDKEYSRHEQYHGIIAKFSNSLKFIDSGADYIQLVLDLYGINEQVELIREEKHPQTDVWTLTYSGYLDLSTWTREKNEVGVKFNSGGLEQLLKSRESEKVEVDRLTTIDGKTIPELSTIDVELEGRRIFLKSKWELKAPNNYGEVFIESEAGNTRDQSVGVPFQLVNQSHENAQSVNIQSNANENYGTTGMMFYAVSERQRTLDISIIMTFKLNVHQEDIGWAWFDINLTKYGNGINYEPISRERLFGLPNKSAIFDASGRTFNVNYQGRVVINIGESLAIEAIEKADLQRRGHAELRITMVDMVGELKMDEDSFHEKTTTKAILAHELADRLVTIVTNERNGFYSDFLARTNLGYPVNGKGAFTGFTHGFWVRGFYKSPEPTEGQPNVENLFKPLTTSFKDFAQSMAAVWNVGIGIEKAGFKERVRLEELRYFYNPNVTIRLPNQVKNVKRTIATDKCYSSLEIGFKEGGDYEEACGLDEYNAKSTFTTVINRIKNTYTKISEYRADSYGLEFARRKQKLLNDTEDTPYDNNVFFLDLKRFIPGLLKQRKWWDDFEAAPTGVFSPETATNLRFSPFNCLLRHSWWFSGGFKKYLSDYIRYGSSTANSQLKTKMINGNEYAENGNIINSELLPARFIPEEIEFEHICDFDIMQQVNGTSIILGKKIQNFYGLVEFKNERNEIEKGFLINLKPNGRGNWKILKSAR